MQPSSISYRRDIDGLRSVAVLPVMLYHFGIPPFSGGFTGVDVFFVISGYLITSILAREIAEGQFSLVGFYERRIRRIIPALVVVILVTMVGGYFLLMPEDLASLGRQSAYSVLGLSNFYFLANTGYFDQSAELLPLLHTWSLAVEEQFYVVWPIALFLLWKIPGRGVVLIALALLSVASLAAAVYQVQTDRTAAFYMLHTRAWELAMGAMLVFVPAITNRALAEAMAAAGMLLIAVGIFALDANDPFPGLNALYPCAGAALIIWPKRTNTVVARALSVGPAVWIGLISYSLYLWHWPVVVLFRHYNNEAMPGFAEAAALIAVSIALATLSYWLVEKPFRRRGIPRSAIYAAGLSAICVVVVAGAVVASYRGIPSRIERSVAKTDLAESWEWKCPRTIVLAGDNTTHCNFGANWSSATTKILLWGDSHADHFAPVIESLIKSSDKISVVMHRRCGPLYGGKVHRVDSFPSRSEKGCRSIYKRGVEILAKNRDINIVMLAASWAGKLDQLYTKTAPDEMSVDRGKALLRKALLELADSIEVEGRTVEVILDIPSWGYRGYRCGSPRTKGLLRRDCTKRDMNITTAHFNKEHGPTNDVILRASREREFVKVINPADGLCDEEICINRIDGEYIYRDRHHLRRNLPKNALKKLGETIGIDRAIGVWERSFSESNSENSF